MAGTYRRNLLPFKTQITKKRYVDYKHALDWNRMHKKQLGILFEMAKTETVGIIELANYITESPPHKISSELRNNAWLHCTNGLLP